MKPDTQTTATPWEFVKAVENEFGIKFAYDMAGSEENKKAPIVFTELHDSLSLPDWPRDGWIWLNPPFNNVGKWADKCLIESKKGAKIISIWPLSGDLNMIDAWRFAGIHIIHGRIWPLVRGCMLIVWGTDPDKFRRIFSGCKWDKKTKSLNLLWYK